MTFSGGGGSGGGSFGVVTVYRVQFHVWRALYKSRPSGEITEHELLADVRARDGDRCLTIWHESGPYCSTIISSIAQHRGARRRQRRTPLSPVTRTHPGEGVPALPRSSDAV